MYINESREYVMEGIVPQYKTLGMLGAYNLVEDIKAAYSPTNYATFTVWIESLSVYRPLLLPKVI